MSDFEQLEPKSQLYLSIDMSHGYKGFESNHVIAGFQLRLSVIALYPPSTD